MSAAGPLSPGLQLAAPKTFGRFDAGDWAISQVPVAGSAYGAARNFENGNYASGAVGVVATLYQAYGLYQNASGAYQNGGWTAAARSVADAATTPFVGENFGAAWRSGLWDLAHWDLKAPDSSNLPIPKSWADAINGVEQNLPADAAQHGYHAWHAGTNAWAARSLGVLGAWSFFAGGIIHETPVDPISWWGENLTQGSWRHLGDSATDIVSNAFGVTLGHSQLLRGFETNALVTRAMEWGNHIPGTYDPWRQP